MRIASAVLVGAAVVMASTTGGSQNAASLSSSPHPTTSSRVAMEACVHVFGPQVGSASRTTVGDVHKSGGGPATPDGDVASRPGRHAFPGEPDDAAAFWCWVGGDGDWTLYGIDASGARVEMYEEYGPSDFAAPLAPDGIAAWF
jgi:hypothetical protein